MARNTLIIIIALLSVAFTGIPKERIRADSTLIVPGVGAEKIILDDPIGTVLHTFHNDEYALTRPDAAKELFTDIIGIKAGIHIEFDKIYYYNLQKIIIFCRNNKVSAIAGMNRDRITIDMVNIKKGVESFVFNYGNKDLSMVKEGNNKIYLYTARGIAIIDDKDDDIIDMFIIYKKKPKKRVGEGAQSKSMENRKDASKGK
ncbi:MAG: hypothetical protein GY754_34545 [bacterium]|nr:hypothetical protein [bacterium]